jgi:hypothetical protein
MKRCPVLDVTCSLWLLFGAALDARAEESAKRTHSLRLDSGTFHGPGALPDSPCAPGLLQHIEFARPLVGETRFFSNGPAAPNVPGGVEIDGETDGLLSNGKPFNEHAWGGISEVGGGALRLMTVVIGGGPNQGREIYTLDRDYHLQIRTDLAMDPGFPEGIVVRDNLRITTGLLWVPRALQSAAGAEGGQDRAGSLPSGVPKVGRLGDFDGDGYLDGTIAGTENVPLGHMFSPGAPVLLERHFTSDIPVRPFDAALLAVANVTSHEPVWRAFVEQRGLDTPAARYITAHVPEHLRALADAWESAGRLLDKAAAAGVAVPSGVRSGVLAARERVATAQAWCRDGVPAGPPPRAVSDALAHNFAAARRIVARLAPATVFKGQ